MTTKWTPDKIGNVRLQAGIPFVRMPQQYDKAFGLLLRGVVTATYVIDDPDHPVLNTAAGITPVAVYCDVLVYSAIKNQRVQFLRRVLVSQETGGLQRGRVWKPRAASIDISENPIDLNTGTNAANLDGDHVLVGFYDDNLNTPVILRGIPHPQADVGNEDKDAGNRVRLKLADGDPDFWKHHGSYYGVSDDGDFVVDTRQANTGALDSKGQEPDPPEDGSVGNQQFRLPKGSTLTVEIEGGATLTLENKEGDAKMVLGDGAVSVAVADHLEVLYNDLKTKYEAHGHTVTGGATGPPLVPNIPLLPWDSNINSNKLLIPDT